MGKAVDGTHSHRLYGFATEDTPLIDKYGSMPTRVTLTHLIPHTTAARRGAQGGVMLMRDADGRSTG